MLRFNTKYLPDRVYITLPSETILKQLASKYERENNYPMLSNTLRSLAEVEALQNKYSDAVNTYSRYVVANDSTNVQTTNQQLTYFTKIFRLNELEQENRIAQAESKQVRLIAFIISGGAILVLAICVLLFIYSRLLRNKNRELVQRIRTQEQAEEHAQEIQVKMEAELPATELSKETILFRKIQSLLSDPEILASTKLGRDELAALVGTNRTYVGEAIRTCTDGLSVSQYIGIVRVKRARHLIDSHPDYSLEDVANACGFQSQSTFTNYYRNYYHITPGEYRKITAEK